MVKQRASIYLPGNKNGKTNKWPNQQTLNLCYPRIATEIVFATQQQSLSCSSLQTLKFCSNLLQISKLCLNLLKTKFCSSQETRAWCSSRLQAHTETHLHAGTHTQRDSLRRTHASHSADLISYFNLIPSTKNQKHNLLS